MPVSYNLKILYKRKEISVPGGTFPRIKTSSLPVNILSFLLNHSAAMFMSDGTFHNSPLNSEKAFEVFFKENYASLCTYCQYKFDFSIDVSKEVTHTAFIKLWENRDSLTPGLPVKGYLYKIITNASLDILRHEKVKRQYQSDIETNFSEGAGKDFNEIDTKELALRLQSAVGALPEQMRKIFELSRYEGLKYAAIAAHLGISVKTVETQMSRALARLRESLSDYLFLILLIMLPWL
jgi:RNA polymerase sigma-70 factor (ECF subfamily)